MNHQLRQDPSITSSLHSGSMEKHSQYQEQNQSFALGNSASDARKPWTSILQLNNRGCVNITLGNYSEASRIFEAALSRQKASADSFSAVVRYGCNHTGLGHPDGAYINSAADATPVDNSSSRAHERPNVEDTEEEFDYDDCSIDSTSCFDDDEDNYDDYMEENDDLYKPLPSLVSLDATYSTGSYTTELEASTFSQSSGQIQRLQRIRRMTASSQLQTFSFTGKDRYLEEQLQQKNRDPSHSAIQRKSMHEIYCLPIVMDEHEWFSASAEDQTFVLIFNTAVCNHLWGMALQQQLKEHSQNQRIHLSQQTERVFLVAFKLYRLALNNASTQQHASPASPDASANGNNNSIDYRLSVLALLNNLSHVSKTLLGPFSREGLEFDKMLLKAVFWWRDSHEQQQRQRQQQQLREHDVDNDEPYDDDDGEIVDMFLDNVFYLIGMPEQVAPAAAA